MLAQVASEQSSTYVYNFVSVAAGTLSPLDFFDPAAIAEEVKRQAMAHEAVAFTLDIDGRRGRLSIADVLSIARQVADAVGAGQRRELHRAQHARGRRPRASSVVDRPRVRRRLRLSRRGLRRRPPLSYRCLHLHGQTPKSNSRRTLDSARHGSPSPGPRTAMPPCRRK